MDTILQLAVWLVLIVGGLGILAVAGFGIRSVVQGKISMLSAAMVAVPLVIALIIRLIVDSWIEAGVIATLVILALAIGALLLSGVRGLTGL